MAQGTDRSEEDMSDNDGYDGHTLAAKDAQIAALRELLMQSRRYIDEDDSKEAAAFLGLARAAIEMSGGVDATLSGSLAPDPAKARPTKATLNWLPKAKPMPYPDDDAPDPADDLNNLAEMLSRDLVAAGESEYGDAPDPAEAMSPAVQKSMAYFHRRCADVDVEKADEAMRARCEAIARAQTIAEPEVSWHQGWNRCCADIADEIAALKGNGEGP
jgi:hypothetical protein